MTKLALNIRHKDVWYLQRNMYLFIKMKPLRIVLWNVNDLAQHKSELEYFFNKTYK